MPDPGRRLSTEEQKADPEKQKVAPPAGVPGAGKRPYDARACRNARIYYQVSCGAPDSQRSYGRSCAEAYALYRESCP